VAIDVEIMLLSIAEVEISCGVVNLSVEYAYKCYQINLEYSAIIIVYVTVNFVECQIAEC